ALLLVVTAVGLGEALVRPGRWTASGPLRCATSAWVGLGLASLLTLALGLAGVMSQATAIAMPLAGGAVWWALVGRVKLDLRGDVSDKLRRWLDQPAGWHWLFAA